MYVQPRIKQLNPDFILIDPQKGIVVIEIKDWSEGYIKEANNVRIIDVAGKRIDNPLVQANKYFNFVKSILQSKQLFFDQYGKFELLVYSRVIFPNMKPEDLEEHKDHFNQVPSECIFDNQLRKLSVDTLFSQDSSFLDDNAVSMIRGLLFPEVKIKPFQTKIWTFNRKDGSRNPIIDTLDAEQEKFARQIPYGHFMVTGVPGSGKTVILLSRAIHLLKEKPGWKIRILTYNKPLANRLRERFESFYEDLDLMGVKYQNITISTFHSLASEISTEAPPFEKKKDRNY